MFRIKICGVTQVTDVDDVAAAGADAVGLNFHPRSIRFLEPARAAVLAARAATAGLTTVGVFVDATAEQILSVVDQCGLDYAQLHGDQTIADAMWLSRHSCRVIRVLRLPPGKLDTRSIRAQVASWKSLDCPLLLDAEVGVHGGGMGTQLDWDSVGRWAAGEGQSVSWGLAGGLSPETVQEAIARTATRAIDVASGVESPRGKKSAARIRAFVAAAQFAWRPTQAGQNPARLAE